jgi:predicted nucleotidyltransferase
MPSAEKISITLPPDMLARLREAVTNGEYASTSEALRDAVRYWERQRPDPAGRVAARQAPALSDIIARLRGAAEVLKSHGVAHLWVFGSVARGTAGPDSDLDLIAEIGAETPLSLTGFARLRADLSDLLGHHVDLAEWHLLRPTVTAAARAEAVQAF